MFAPSSLGKGSGIDKENPREDVELKGKEGPGHPQDLRKARTGVLGERRGGPRPEEGKSWGRQGAFATRGRAPNSATGAQDSRRPHLDGVEFARQHRLQVQEQGDRNVGEEVEAQQPLQAAPGAPCPHHPLVGLRRSGRRNRARTRT